MSFREKLVDSTSSLLTTIGVSKESAAYVTEKLGSLLETAEVYVTGVPTVKEVEKLWFETYEKKSRYEVVHRKVFTHESIYSGLKGTGTEREKHEKETLDRLKGEEAAAKRVFDEAAAKANEAQDKILKARAASKPKN